MLIVTAPVMRCQFTHEAVMLSKIADAMSNLNVIFAMCTSATYRYHMVKVNVVRLYRLIANMANAVISFNNSLKADIANLYAFLNHLAAPLALPVHLLIVYIVFFTVLALSAPISVFITIFNWFLAISTKVSQPVRSRAVCIEMLNRLFGLTFRTHFREKGQLDKRTRYPQGEALYRPTALTDRAQSSLNVDIKIVSRGWKRSMARCTDFTRRGIHILTPSVSALFGLLPGRQGRAFSAWVANPCLDNISIIPFFRMV